MQDIVYLNGSFVPREQAVVSVEDRGYQFADGIYEVTKFYGHTPFRLRQHLERLERSAGFMGITGTLSISEWEGVIAELMERCELPADPASEYTLYQQVTRGVYPRAHLFPRGPHQPASIAYFRKAPVYQPELREEGIALSAQPDERWNRCCIKTICLLPAIWAKQAAVNAGANEAVLVRDGIVTEGASTNTFCIIGGEILTHPEGGRILSGVTRQVVFEAAERAGIKVTERPVTLEELVAAQEVFVSSTTMGIMPVSRVDDAVIGAGCAGPMTRRLARAMGEIVEEDLAAAR